MYIVNNPKVSFDYDSTLSRKDVQEYAKELIQKGIDVWVITSRFDDLHKHRYPESPTNENLYETLEKIGIPRWKVRFTLMEPKSRYLINTQDVVWHLDDDIIELENMILDNCHVAGIHVEKEDWKEQCNRLLNL